MRCEIWFAGSSASIHLLKVLSFSCDTYLMILISVKSPATTNNWFIAVFFMHQYLKKCFYSSSHLISCDTYLMRINSYLMWYVSHENYLLTYVIRIPWESPLTWCDTYPMILISLRSPINNCLISVPILERMIYNGSNLNPMWYVSHENHLLSLWHVSHDSYIRLVSSKYGRRFNYGFVRCTMHCEIWFASSSASIRLLKLLSFSCDTYLTTILFLLAYVIRISWFSYLSNLLQTQITDWFQVLLCTSIRKNAFQWFESHLMWYVSHENYHYLMWYVSHVSHIYQTSCKHK
jgi:hypothetical protein